MNRQRATAVFYVLAGTTRLGSTLAFTVLTIYYVRAAGMDPLQLVLAGTALEATYLLLSVPTGAFADAVGRRISVILGVAIGGIAFLMVGLLPTFAWILAANAVMAVASAFEEGASQAWIAGEVGEEAAGPVFIRARQLGRAVTLVAIPASVALGSVHLAIPWLVAGGCYLALAAFLLVAMPEDGFRRAPRVERDTWAEMRKTLGEGARLVRGSSLLLGLLAVGAFAGAASEGIDRLAEAHLLANFRFPTLAGVKPVVWFGVLDLAETLIGLILTHVFRGRLETAARSSVPTARVLFVLTSAGIALLFIFGSARAFAVAAVTLVAIEVLRGLAHPMYDAFLVQNTEPATRATVISMAEATDALGQVVGGPALGVVGNVSLRAAMFMSGVLVTPALVLYRWVIRHRKPDRQASAGLGTGHGR